MVRDALMTDAGQIHQLLLQYTKEGLVLPRALTEIYQDIREFVVTEDDGLLTGVCSLHIWWQDLAEVRSLAVRKGMEKQGLGKKLVEACLEEARSLGLTKIFALTYRPDFFARLGFVVIDKSELPQKIWGDCVKCPKFPECDETAVRIEI
ncbi:MAG: N-acetyltransferase [Deltaproteobacteria bacterium]|nr:N-acetyltransferase [Deltaproteobacteria bacterium]